MYKNSDMEFNFLTNCRRRRRRRRRTYKQN